MRSPLLWAQGVEKGMPNAHSFSCQLLSNPLAVVVEAAAAAGKSQNSERNVFLRLDGLWSQEGGVNPFLFALSSCQLALDAGREGHDSMG